MQIATWNVNSVKQRHGRLLEWLDSRRPDVVCLQETKLADGAFTDLLGDELRSRGYEFALNGEVQWNGVAIASRVGLDDVDTSFPGQPGWAAKPEAEHAVMEVPAIVSEAEFEAVQRSLKARSPKMMPPMGRAARPTPKVANEARSAAVSSPFGKNRVGKTSTAAVA